jgi:hypothetical protein
MKRGQKMILGFVGTVTGIVGKDHSICLILPAPQLDVDSRMFYLYNIN